jgi:hypothetical protein
VSQEVPESPSSDNVAQAPPGNDSAKRWGLSPNGTTLPTLPPLVSVHSPNVS